MPNLLGKQGAQPQKQTRFAPIYNGRFSVGLVTNRSPLRGSQARLIENFYGAYQDTLIAGSNVEITNKLTLARRSGSSVYDSNSYTAVNSFYPFRLFSSTSEQIDVMVDQASMLYSLYQGILTPLWSKQPGAGQSFMQSVGNSLYWGDGVSNKKWLQTLNQWTATTQLNGPLSPVMGTFLIDSNGNLQQYTGTVFPVTAIGVSSNVLRIESSVNLIESGIVPGAVIQFPASGMNASFLEGQTVTVLQNLDVYNLSATFTHANYTLTDESGVLANEVSGTSMPITGATVPSAAAATFPVTNVGVSGNALRIESSVNLIGLQILPGTQIQFPASGMNASFLENQIVTVVQNLDYFNISANFTHADYTFSPEANVTASEVPAVTFPVTELQVASDVLTITSSVNLLEIGLKAGTEVQFPSSGMAASFLEGQTVTVTGYLDLFHVTASFTHANYGPAGETGVYGLEVGGANGWSTEVPAISNNFQGGLTNDGTVQWTNRGNPVENWGIANTTKALTPVVGSTTIAWRANTYFSLPGVVVDSNGNLQQVTVAGLSAGTVPVWSTSSGGVTYDGTVRWKMIQSAASMVWQPSKAYVASISLALTSVAAGSGGTTVYTGSITGGASNALAGKSFVVAEFQNPTNNGNFLCTASSLTTLTLQNGAGVAETNSGVAFTEGNFVIGNAYGTNCLYRLGPSSQPVLDGEVKAYLFPTSHGGAVGAFTQVYPVDLGTALCSDLSLNSLSFYGEPRGEGADLTWNIVNGAGEFTGTVQPFLAYEPESQYDYNLIILTSLNVPVPGQYTFKIAHQDGMFWGIGNGATLVSGPSAGANTIGQTITAAEGYPSFGGTNGAGGTATDTYTVNFPTAGVYPLEVNYHYWYHSGQTFSVTCNGFNLANGAPESGTNVPVWPSWSTTYAPSYPSVTETNGQLTWLNLGPATDFAWAANTNFTLPDTSIIDPNGNNEAPYRSGVTGAAAPTFSTGYNSLTVDNPNLIWINVGTANTTPTNTVSTYNGGWMYAVALVNSLDNTVSNCCNLSAATGNFVGADGVILAPGAGLPAVAKIDPQSDLVAIFRTTDGQATPFLIPGPYPDVTPYTLPLAEYLENGYTDLTPDTGLNNLISGAINGENTPPATGATNLTYHLNRIFFSIGNTVYWTAGSDTPVGNGVNGVPPLNFDNLPSLVKRIVPTTSGAIVFTVSDIYIIQGLGTASNPIQTAIPLMQGVGLASYNALDVNGSTIGFFTTDNQFCILDPSSGVSYAGFPIGDQLRMNNGTPGQNWNPASVYVSWYVNGEDQGWFLSDGSAGWYKLMPTPAPESGNTWSPFASIVGGCKAVQSVEVTPGVHKLLIGPTGTGPLLYRDLYNWEDNGSTYAANAVVGSVVLAQPGQVAMVAFITTDSIRTGTPLTLGLILDEALPVYTGPFDILKVWENDPPGLKPSRSFYSQRFYLSEMQDEAVCRHMQIQIQWAEENAANEAASFTVYGAFNQEN